MKISKIYLIALILIGVIVAWWFVGDVALAGLLSLLGVDGKRKYNKAQELKQETEVNEELAAIDKKDAVRVNDEIGQANKNITEIVNTPVDFDKPINEVVADAKEDWG